MRRAEFLIILLYSVSIGLAYSNPVDSTQIVTHPTQSVNAASQRYFDTNFKDKYQSQEYEYKDKKKNALERWLESKPKKEKVRESSPVWPFFFKLVVIIALAYAVFVIIGVLLGKKGNWIFNKKSEQRTLQYGDEDEDIQESDFVRLIRQAIESGDYRLAVRYQYLHTLQKLNGKGIIDYHKEKTNADYRYEIKKPLLGEAFSYISYIYDHAWYGGFELSQGSYRMAESAFDETNKMI